MVPLGGFPKSGAGNRIWNATRARADSDCGVRCRNKALGADVDDSPIRGVDVMRVELVLSLVRKFR